MQPECQLRQHTRLLPLRLPRGLQRGWLHLLRWGPWTQLAAGTWLGRPTGTWSHTLLSTSLAQPWLAVSGVPQTACPPNATAACPAPQPAQRPPAETPPSPQQGLGDDQGYEKYCSPLLPASRRGVGMSLWEFSGTAVGSSHLQVGTLSVSYLTLSRCGRVCGQCEPV